jgi:hypothetical protein
MEKKKTTFHESILIALAAVVMIAIYIQIIFGK